MVGGSENRCHRKARLIACQQEFRMPTCEVYQHLGTQIRPSLCRCWLDHMARRELFAQAFDLRASLPWWYGRVLHAELLTPWGANHCTVLQFDPSWLQRL